MWRGRNFAPTKDKAFIFKVKKRGFDESIDKFRLSVVSLSDWLAYLTHFLYRLEFKTMPRSHLLLSSFDWSIGLLASVYQFC